MKITITPTEDQSNFQAKHPIVSIEIPGDDHEIRLVIEDLVKPALLAYGFHPVFFEEYFGG